MDLDVFSMAVQNALGTQLPSILGAVGVLIVGYICAVLARAATRKLLSLAKLNTWVNQSVGKPVDIEGSVALAVFWFALLLTLIGVFNTLSLERLSDPFAQMMAQVMTYLPHLLAGVVLLLTAWLVALLVKAVANRALKATQWDAKITEQAGVALLGENVGNVLFWLVILMFLPGILGVLQLEGMLDPVRSMVQETLGMVPDIFKALVIVLAGWLVAKIFGGLVANLLRDVGADRLGKTAGFKEALPLSKLVGLLVFILIFVPTLIAGLEALHITAISHPATDMLSMMMTAIPNIFAAALIVFLTWYVARYAAHLLGGLLANSQADTLPAKVGVGHVFSKDLKLSDFVPRLLIFFAMLFAVVEASNRLGFGQVEQLVTRFIDFGADVLLGLVILMAGFWLAGLAQQAVLRASGEHAGGLACVARYAILGLVLAMGLSAMGVADNIVHMAFALVFGAVAVAVALSFGLGGREAAGKQMEYWLSGLRKDK